MKIDCDKNCVLAGAHTTQNPCDRCGWNPTEMERRADYIQKHGLKKRKDKLRRLVLKEMRK